MKYLIMFIFLCSVIHSQDFSNQGFGFYDNGYVVTDSVIWRTISVDSLNLGNINCVHQWVYSRTRLAMLGVGYGVFHNGFHCSYNDRIRDRICKLCLRKETQRESWYQHREEPPKTEYEILKEKLKKAKWSVFMIKETK